MKLPNNNELRIPFLTAYGIIAVILLFLNKYMKHINIFIRVFIYTIICTFLECIMGKISYLFTNNKEWNYHEHL